MVAGGASQIGKAGTDADAGSAPRVALVGQTPAPFLCPQMNMRQRGGRLHQGTPGTGEPAEPAEEHQAWEDRLNQQKQLIDKIDPP